MTIGFTLITESPLWFVVLCLAAGALVAMLLYYRNGDQAIRGKKRWMLALVRFLVVSLIAFLLLNPLVKRFAREKEMPVIVLAMDNSESMLLGSKDTAATAAMLRNTFAMLEKELSGDYEVETYTFGESVRDTSDIHFREKETHISALFTTLETRLAGRNAGALVLISDGIYNRGINPVSLLDRINMPVYSVTCGDTTLKRDLVLAEVNYNRIAYLGNTFPVEIVIKATRCTGLNSRLVIRNNEKTLFNQPVTINSEQFSQILQVNLNADKEGILGYEVFLEPVKDEVTLANNRTRAFVEVLSGKKKILVLGSKPHPDLGAIHNALLFNDQLEAEVALVNELKSPLSDFDCVFMHQLPDDQRSADLLSQCLKLRIPLMVIGGGATRHDLISAAGAAPGLVAGKVKGQHNEVMGALNPGFALFGAETSFTDQLSSLPPLQVPFGKFESNAGEQSLLLQRIGNITTPYPLVSFYQLPGNRTGYVAGEGIWKWRMFSFRNTKSHKAFDSFLNQWVQYLTANDDRSRFRVTTRNYVSENQSIVFSAELYDAAFNPVVDPEVALTVTGSDGKKYPYTFTRKERFYHLDAGRMPVGEYRYNATTALGSEKFSASGRFVVAPIHIESTVTRADHALLRSLSLPTGAIAVPAEQAEKITAHIKSRDDIKPVSHLREKFRDLTSLAWLLGVLLFLLGLEWFIRKWSGSY